jgi:hypothetical protein
MGCRHAHLFSERLVYLGATHFVNNQLELGTAAHPYSHPHSHSLSTPTPGFTPTPSPCRRIPIADTTDTPPERRPAPCATRTLVPPPLCAPHTAYGSIHICLNTYAPRTAYGSTRPPLHPPSSAAKRLNLQRPRQAHARGHSGAHRPAPCRPGWPGAHRPAPCRPGWPGAVSCTPRWLAGSEARAAVTGDADGARRDERAASEAHGWQCVPPGHRNPSGMRGSLFTAQGLKAQSSGLGCRVRGLPGVATTPSVPA